MKTKYYVTDIRDGKRGKEIVFLAGKKGTGKVLGRTDFNPILDSKDDVIIWAIKNMKSLDGRMCLGNKGCY